MEVTVELALEELRNAYRLWFIIGSFLKVGILQDIMVRHGRDERRCLEEVMKDWLKNGKDISWSTLCSALEAAGQINEAKRIREKYSAQGTGTCQLQIGSAVLTSDPPLFGIIRWIGVIYPMKEGFAGVELEISIDGCTDGVCSLTGDRYFTCPPNRAHFCLLTQLTPDNNAACDSKSHLLQCLSVGKNAVAEGNIFKCKGEAGYNVPGVVKFLEPLSPLLNYFEYEIVKGGERCAMGIGVGELNYPLDRMPGWNSNSVGCHADDGKLYNQCGVGSPLGPCSFAGDRMGCGVDFENSIGSGYVSVFFTRNGEQVNKPVTMKRPSNGLYPLVGLCSRGEKVRYLGHCRRLPSSPSPYVRLDTTPWLRSNGVIFKNGGLTVEYCGNGLHLDAHDMGVAQANLSANSGNHYFEMEILNPGKEGSLAIGLAEPNYPLYLYPGSTKGSIAYHTGHLYNEASMKMQCNRIGCGLQYGSTEPQHQPTRELVCKVFFTNDGVIVGEIECLVPREGLYPFVAIMSSGGKVRVNFESWTSGIDFRSMRKSAEMVQQTPHLGAKIEKNSMPIHNDQTVNQLQTQQDQLKKEISKLRKEHSISKAFWTVPNHHVSVLETSIGKGTWGCVQEGEFRGQRVAVKCINKEIVTRHTLKRVYREIYSLAQVRHPNLVLFIAAVLDGKEGPMIITEMLDTTLRKAYEDNLLKSGLNQCMNIFCDIASALCYLHELETPIIHRDVSSSNVLLQALANDKWKAKLSDFGSANWALEAATLGEGTLAYTAPEAYPVHPSLHHTAPLQTTKIDVYSYGILVCEVVMRKLPTSDHLDEIKALLKVKHSDLHSLVQKCTQNVPEQRPTMVEILEELHNGV